jgi:S1-C subfamily serine protease
LAVPENLQGKQVRCPKCSKLTLVPASEAVTPTAPSGAAATAAKASERASEAITKAAPRPSPARSPQPTGKASARAQDKEGAETPTVRHTGKKYRDSEDSDDRPRRRKQTKSPLPWILGGVGGGVVLGLVVLAVLVMTGRSETKSEPVVEDQAPAKKTPRVNPGQQLAVRSPKQFEPPQPVPIPAGPAPKEISPESTSRVKRATAYLRVKYANGSEAEGSGFFAAEKGLVFTNAHVLGMLNPSAPAPAQVNVVVGSGEPGEFTRRGQVLGVDRVSDLGVLRVEGDVAGLPDPLPVDNSRNLTELQKVYIFGFPFGERLGKNITISESTVSSIRREVDGSVAQVQLNGGMHQGNSGGPVVDSRGVVIGVAVAIIRGTQINFAVPGARVNEMLRGRVADLELGDAYRLTSGGEKLPIEIDCLDPMNRLQEIKVDAWLGNHGSLRPPAFNKPPNSAGDGARQTTALAYHNNKALGEIDLLALDSAKVDLQTRSLWIQPVLTDKAGVTYWATAVAYKLADLVSVERKPALLQVQPDLQPERTLKIVSSNKVVEVKGKLQRSLSFNVEAQALEVAKKEAQGANQRLTLGDTKFAIQLNDKSFPQNTKVDSMMRGAFLNFLTNPVGNLLTRAQPTLKASLDRNTREDFYDRINQIANAYELTCISFPNRAVQPKETWTTKVPILFDSYTGKEPFDLHLTCTLEGCRQASGEEQAVINLTGTLKNRKPGVSLFTGKVTGKVFFATAKGYVAGAKLKVDCEVDYASDALASYIMEVNLTRVPGNTAGITPAKEAPPPVVAAKGKTLFQVATATLGPGDPKDYPGRLQIPYKVWKMPFMAGKTYIIEMNKVGDDPIDPYLIVHNPFNVKVAEDDDSGGDLNARIVFQAPVSGFYLVYTTTLDLNQGGNFQFTVSEAAADAKTGKTDTKKIDTKKVEPKKGAPKGRAEHSQGDKEKGSRGEAETLLSLSPARAGRAPTPGVLESGPHVAGRIEQWPLCPSVLAPRKARALRVRDWLT